MTNNDNPHNFTEELILDLHIASSKMYDEFYDLLATYQFGFSPEQKAWMLGEIVKDIEKANKDSEMP